MTITAKIQILREKAELFAKQELACRENLDIMVNFPLDIWGKMGKANYLGLNLPALYGGAGENNLAVTVAGEAFVASGHNMGLIFSWVVHLIISRFLILEFGTEKQKAELISKMTQGTAIASFAVSEPETGPHPKYIKTTAILKGKTYVLNGKKVFLTNGPVADFFIIIAQTEIKEGRKRYSAFIVPKETPGLLVLKPMKLDILRPAVHGAVELVNCIIPVSALLGETGSAYEKMVKPFGEIEDVLTMGPVIGGMTRQIELIIDIIHRQLSDLTDESKEILGKIISMTHGLKFIAYESASMLDIKRYHMENPSLLLSFRSFSANIQSLLKQLIDISGITPDKKFDRITKDISFAIRTDANTTKIKQRKLAELFLKMNKNSGYTYETSI